MAVEHLQLLLFFLMDNIALPHLTFDIGLQVTHFNVQQDYRILLSLL